MLKYKQKDTPVGIVRNSGRINRKIWLTTLGGNTLRRSGYVKYINNRQYQYLYKGWANDNTKGYNIK